MSDRRHAEVIVVGAGPAGAATATFLARNGIEVTLVDRARFPRDKPCAEYLSPQATRLLDELGALSAIEAAGPAQLTGMRVTAPDGTAFLGEFAARHGFRGFRDRGLALRRTVLDAILVDRAREAGAQIQEGVAVRDLVRDGAAVRGVVVTGDAHTTTLRAPLVIGADGLRSVVSRRLGLARQGRWPRRYAVVTHYTGVAGIGPQGEMHVFADGYAGLADVGHGVTNVAVVVPASLARDLSGDPSAFLERWLDGHAALNARFASAQRVSPVVVTGPFNQRAARAWAPGAALVGDAADFFDPFTGEGIYAALRGAELLAPYAFEVARNHADARRAAVALAAWDRARRDEFRGKARVERLVGAAVGAPAIFTHVAHSLARRRDMADLLVGVAGDFVPPDRVLRPGFLFRLLVPGRAPDRAGDDAPSSHPA
ncbi:MAG: NAD(P)/FAD-dependent oxidoreductase [Gemmatimonadaceae bacterium]|nr:NAD(P)/FAD-dependent oxidoreductase [Gemmatimonadaceae bacterium]